MKYTKLIFTLLMINYGFTLKAQVPDSLTVNTFENRTFITNQIIGFKDMKYNPIVLNIEFDEPNGQYISGDITTFNGGKFSSSNSGPCGNECRVNVSGRYSYKGNKIILFLETIAYSKDCSKEPMRKINKEIGVFVWNKNKNGTIILTSGK